ncbi:glutaminase [Litorilituus sediminis]|uniref:Glutaminase n=2 Tax=Litorilituus sediminis TaxID=718192 RepID=A0A4P6P9H0_9GAMM|nr:glutaminase [Litorilituus sediminis]
MTNKAHINYQLILEQVFDKMTGLENSGQVATYIPQLAKVDANKLGIHLIDSEQSHYSVGDACEKFSIQSIAKVLSLTLALKARGDSLWQRVGVEPSGSAFNSLVQLEYEKGRPRNPFINAGAIVVCDVLISEYRQPKSELLKFIRALSGNAKLSFDPAVAESEKRTSYRNNALAHLMKDFGNIDNDIETVLDLYCYLCSIEMTCQEMAQTFMYLADNGVNPLTGEVVVSSIEAKRINAIMQLCGFYDEAGEFSFTVGLPGKSGVGGGIIAIHPKHYSVAVWSPKLNSKGNSFIGMKVLEAITTISQSSIF